MLSNGNQSFDNVPPADIAVEMTWRDRIRIAREKKGLTQSQLGELVGKGQTTIASYEKLGGNEPTLDVIAKIADATDTTSLWIIFGMDGAVPAATEEEQRFDRDAMLRIIAMVERRARKNALQDWPPESKARFILAQYDIYNEFGGDFDALEQEIDRLIKRRKKEH